jgi:hypothetical protein
MARGQQVTEDQLNASEKAALAEIQQKGLPWAAQRVAALEYILAAQPQVAMPTMVRALEGRDLFVGWDPPQLVANLPPREVGLPPPIVWKIPLPTSHDVNFIPEQPQPWWLWPSEALAFVLGAAADHALFK